jgi:hypothetical protein
MKALVGVVNVELFSLVNFSPDAFVQMAYQLASYKVSWK